MFFRNLAITAALALATRPSATSADTILEIAASSDDFSTLAAAVTAAEPIASALGADGTYTVFAPVNSAFEALPEGLVAKLLEPQWGPQLEDLLKYHVLGSVVKSTDLSDGLEAETLNGESITVGLDPPRVNDANILVDSVVDVQADNGVVHGVDALLVPSSVTNDVVDIAQGNDAFETLVQAVIAADLVGALKGEGPLTVFAPTDDAFAALPEGTLASLLEPENKGKLVEILQYHVVPANAVSSGLSSGAVPTLLPEKTLDVEVTDEGVMVNGAKVTAADILASNGVVHVVDAVLLPPEEEMMDEDMMKNEETAPVPAPADEPASMPEADAATESSAPRGMISWGAGLVAAAAASIWAA